ncbi:MAG TPA: alkyl sulfatase dimerization domain-containing protein [Polyangia bacterium]
MQFGIILRIYTVMAALVIGAASLAGAQGQAKAQASAQDEVSWYSPSLTMQTVTAPNGAITTRVAAEANVGMGAAKRVVEQMAPGVYHIRGWGIAHSIAIDAPDGWIIVDTSDSTRVAAEMRAALEKTVGHPIKVAAILFTHWHYADGTGAWKDSGTELWGHEFLDSNRSTAAGVNVLRGVYNSRAIAQFGVFHPPEGPDAFPNLMGFTPEKFLSKSSYMPPEHLFKNGQIMELTIAGEPIIVAPNRSDTTDSVGFYFPRRRTLVSNFMVTGTIFNIYTLRGGAYRDPAPLIEDLRRMESKNAEVLLDIHGPGVKGEQAVRDEIHRSADQVQLIRDQTLRMIAQGMDAREAAENIFMPANLRDGFEGYGQVESHVRQVYNGTLGWFGGDVYEINPLSLHEEAARTIAMMGGADKVRAAAETAAREGGLANWRWALKLTTMLLTVDPQDASARQIRATASRALGQRTTSANARGFYITEALQLEGKLMVNGQPATLDQIRTFLGTPSLNDLTETTVADNLELVRYLVDPRKADGRHVSFTLAVDGDPKIWRVELRDCVLVISTANAPEATHVRLSRKELAQFVLGQKSIANGNPSLASFEDSLDRSHLMPPPTAAPLPLAVDPGVADRDLSTQP